ncbi:MAG: SMC-Scp complex subunit ScpB [Gammaproteobacteria bacterium]
MKPKPEMVNAVEAALFSSERPLSLRDLQILFDKRAKKESIEQALVQLQEDYRDRGVELVEVAGGFRFQTRAVHASALRALRESRPPRYSRALLETLAIIAYRQPVTRGDIEEIRGVTVTTEIMRVLIDREWIRQSGNREVPGHPALYVTTPLFLEYFGLGSISELPRLDEERQLAEIAKELGIDMPESLRISDPRQGDEERPDTASNDMDSESDSEDPSGPTQRPISPEVDMAEHAESEADQEASKVAST